MVIKGRLVLGYKGMGIERNGYREEWLQMIEVLWFCDREMVKFKSH